MITDKQKELIITWLEHEIKESEKVHKKTRNDGSYGMSLSRLMGVEEGLKRAIELIQNPPVEPPKEKPHKHRWILVPPADDWCPDCDTYR